MTLARRGSAHFKFGLKSVLSSLKSLRRGVRPKYGATKNKSGLVCRWAYLVRRLFVIAVKGSVARANTLGNKLFVYVNVRESSNFILLFG